MKKMYINIKQLYLNIKQNHCITNQQFRNMKMNLKYYLKNVELSTTKNTVISIKCWVSNERKFCLVERSEFNNSNGIFK